MSRKLILGIGAGLLAALLGGWFFLGRTVDRIDGALTRQLGRVENLDVLVNDANGAIDEGYRRMEEARMREESARARIEEAESVATAAAEERSEAEGLTAEALERERLAREQAEEAQRRERAERRRREEEWSRLARALNKVAPTRREDSVLTADLGAGFVRDKEKISRLAGILLAHHGYRADLEGEGSDAAATYLEQAGIPRDILRRGSEAGRLRLFVRDEILGPATP